ncbi:MAG TPA: malectin domain-containing carbohydrate-binding protein, partial [Rariglobus sp.]
MKLSSSRSWFSIIFCLVLDLLSPAWALNHNPAGGDPSGSSDISIESVTGQLGENGEVTVTLTIQEDNVRNGGGFAQGPAIVRFFAKDENGNKVQMGEDAEGVEGINTYTLSSDCGCAFDVKLFGIVGETEQLAGTETDVHPQAAGANGSGGGEMGSIHVMYKLGRNANGNGGTLYLSTDNPKIDLYSPESLSITGDVVVNTAGSVPTSFETDEGLTTVNVVSDDKYELKFYNKSDSSLIKTVTFENPGATQIAGTTDDTLFQSSRWGRKFSYDFAVPNGPLKVRFGFAELYHDTSGAGVFNVSAEGAVVLPNYDVLAAAGARNTARVEEVSMQVTDGELNLSFDSVTYGAQVSTIEVVRDAAAISGTVDDALYQSAHGGASTWTAPLVDGDYEVTLHFEEPFYTESAKRVFDVKAQGSIVLDDYDIYAEAGGAQTAKSETFTVTVAGGQLSLEFVAVTDEPRVNAINVKSASSGLTVAAVNAGGPSFTAADGTVFAADSGFVGGEMDYPGKPVIAINAGGLAYTASSGTTYEADSHFDSGKKYLGAQNRLLVTDQPASGAPITYDYTWFTIPHTGKFGECVLSYAGGLKKEGKLQVWSTDEQSYVDIRTLRDSDDNLLSKIATTYEKFDFGFAKVSEVRDPDGAALATTWTYYERTNPSDPAPNGHGLEKSMNRYDGYWEDYTYDSAGRRTKTVSRYLDSATHVESDNKVETYAYGTANPTSMRVTTIKGQEVARSYQAKFDHADEREEWTITAVTPGATWDAAGNLITKTRTYKSSHPTTLLQGKTKWISRPEGTMNFYSYVSGSGTRTVTTDTGAPNSGLTAIVAGTRTITITNTANQQIGSEIIDIASGLTLSSWDALEIDELGRPTLIGYGDGTTRAITYVGSSASCGTCSGSGTYLVASEVDRNGVITTYGYDLLNRRISTTRLGVTEKLIYDSSGRVVERIRIGSDDSEIVQGKTAYDVAGRVSVTEDALGNETTYAYIYPSGGGLTTTTTFPATTAGAGTRIETVYADGRTKEISGTAVSPLKYAYGTWTASGQAGEWTQEIKVGESSSETEWTKTYADIAGRTVKMDYPAPTGTVSATLAYNTLGQLVRQTDPDGVQTLFAYNAKGEREVTAVDLDQDGIIDYTGTDRITKTVSDVYSRSGTVVSRSTTQVWATDASNTSTTVAVTERDGYGNHSWQTDAAGAESSTVISRTTPGSWAVTSIRADGSRQVQTYISGRLATTSS